MTDETPALMRVLAKPETEVRAMSDSKTKQNGSGAGLSTSLSKALLDMVDSISLPPAPMPDDVWEAIRSDRDTALMYIQAAATEMRVQVRKGIRQMFNATGQGRRHPYPEPDCSASDFDEPDDREERCNGCGEASHCLMNGLCQMCYELNGGTHD